MVRVQRLTPEFFQGCGGCGRKPRGLGLETRPIDRIAQKRMPDCRKVHPDLVCAAGLEPAGEQACDRLSVSPRVAFADRPMGDCVAPAFAHRELLAGPRIAVERLVDRAFGPVRRPPDEGQITAFERPLAAMIGELPGKATM